MVVLSTRFLGACGTKDSTTSTDPVTGGHCSASGTLVAIQGNHGHALTVSAADIVAGAAKSYDITGTADHSHTVNLAASDFASLNGNVGIRVTSSSTGHTHSITINCAG